MVYVLRNDGLFAEAVIKLDKLGNLIWEQNFGDISDNEAYCIKQTIDGGYLIAGKIELYGGNPWEDNDDQDFWIAKFSPFQIMEELGNPPVVGTIECE